MPGAVRKLHECKVGAGWLLSEVMENLVMAPSQVSCKATLAQATVSLSVSGLLRASGTYPPALGMVQKLAIPTMKHFVYS